MKIPKIFMQTWKDNNIPGHWQESPASVKRLMPDWEYILMTDEMNRDFVKEYFPDFLETYDNFPYPIQRADAIRYMWLYIKGGVYMDLDIVLNKSLEPLFEDKEVYLVPSGNISYWYTNAFMASVPGCSFWLECIEEMKKEPEFYWIGRHLYVLNTTGPRMLTRVVHKSKANIGVLPSKLLTPCSLCDIPCSYSPEVYAYAIPGTSWATWDTHMYNFFFCHWMKIFVIILLFLFIFMLWWLMK